MSCQRICQRDRIAEQSVSTQFWYNLHEAFEDMLIGKKHEMAAIKNVPVLIIDANVDINEHPEYISESVNKIVAFIKVQSQSSDFIN